MYFLPKNDLIKDFSTQSNNGYGEYCLEVQYIHDGCARRYATDYHDISNLKFNSIFEAFCFSLRLLDKLIDNEFICIFDFNKLS